MVPTLLLTGLVAAVALVVSDASHRTLAIATFGAMVGSAVFGVAVNLGGDGGDSPTWMRMTAATAVAFVNLAVGAAIGAAAIWTIRRFSRDGRRTRRPSR